MPDFQTLVAAYAARATWEDDAPGWELSIARLWQPNVVAADVHAIEAYMSATRALLLDAVARGDLALHA